VSPTMMALYSVGQIFSSDRPVASTFAVGGRYFFPAAEGALHGSVARSLNRGRITTETTYGQVSAWLAEVAYLQTLWTEARGRVSYRYYREDEITRAFADELVMGSDLVGVNLSQTLPKGVLGEGTQRFTVEASAQRYLTNIGVAGTIFEVGLLTAF